MKLPYRILVLDDDENALAGIVELLRNANYHVTAAATYDAAKRLLALGSYDLLIADVRLRGFNGLNLVRQTHRDRPNMATIIMTGYDEPMVALEAGRYAAEYVVKPLRPADFMRTVARSLADIRRPRRSPRKRVLGGFRVSANGRPAAVVDVCYSGLRLEMAADDRLPPTLDIEIAGIGLHLEVEVVWCQAAVEGAAVICGATLASEVTPAARTWRAIVDRLSV
ncbi:MAG: response regulator [Acidobacteriota bacterium]